MASNDNDTGNKNKRKPTVQAAATTETASMAAQADRGADTGETDQGPGADTQPGPTPGGPAPEGTQAGLGVVGAGDVDQTMPQAEAAREAAQGGSDISHIASAEHALPVLRSKITRLHQLVHNIGEIAMAPVHEIETLMADVQYLVGIIRSKI